jgi:hypothetical protein
MIQNIKRVRTVILTYALLLLMTRLPIYLILLLAILTTGCDEDFTELDLVLSTTSAEAGSMIGYSLSVNAIDLVSRYEIKASVGEEVVYRYISTPNTEIVRQDSSFFVGNRTGDLTVTAKISDTGGSTVTDTEVAQITGPVAGNLVLNWRLSYDDSPLVFFTPYEYDNYEITFTRFTTYISELTLGDRPTDDRVFYATVGDSHVDVDQSAQGYSLPIAVAPGTYEGLQIGLGVNPELNATRPSDWPSGHPLASSGEYWLSWTSYVFTKVEGTIDLDGDGISDRSFALHLGGDVAYQSISTEDTITIVEGEDTEIRIGLDIRDWFYGVENGPYNLIDEGSIHSTQHIPLIERLQADYNNLFTIDQ